MTKTEIIQAVSRLKKVVKTQGVVSLSLSDLLTLQNLLREHFSNEVELMFALRKELKSRSNK